MALSAVSVDKDMSAEELRKKLDSMTRQNKRREKKGPDWEAIKQPKGNIALRAFEEI